MNNTDAARKSERLFVAIRLPRIQRELLENAASRVSSDMKFAKWTHSEDYHITVQFLGDTPVGDIPGLLDALKGISGKQSPFHLNLDHFGTFGPASAPRVLWAGVSGELDKLKELQKNVVSATGPLGFIAETREYNPHITLARKYRDQEPFAAQRLQEYDALVTKTGNECSSKGWTVDAFVVYATKMHAIPMYEVIEKVTFFNK
ncbi:RNA 2',3'-cyclic phosphodiesterase [Paenibacillus sp. PK3_47]|uniref:RNA 2',3'-cyclic phosphodiesterase n=1 Tax=Paenibacillus sp. PK3_47 TaxID=2072642 RepID=UPI00201D38E9|nr:RNA 2',3'-cyclic phosphodiesterase [Paenibacillus sp. PK3_47]UQZ35069.1 RNA 2',3'-cyclic phosphodiesterase [Paenibacillus sp. PK3_47]